MLSSKNIAWNIVPVIKTVNCDNTEQRMVLFDKSCKKGLHKELRASSPSEEMTNHHITFYNETSDSLR